MFSVFTLKVKKKSSPLALICNNGVGCLELLIAETAADLLWADDNPNNEFKDAEQLEKSLLNVQIKCPLAVNQHTS